MTASPNRPSSRALTAEADKLLGRAFTHPKKRMAERHKKKRRTAADIAEDATAAKLARFVKSLRA